jgi:hypothetical protein
MFTKDFGYCINPDGTVKVIDTIRREFITGTNATCKRIDDMLVITWKDYYDENKHGE